MIFLSLAPEEIKRLKAYVSDPIYNFYVENKEMIIQAIKNAKDAYEMVRRIAPDVRDALTLIKDLKRKIDEVSNSIDLLNEKLSEMERKERMVKRDLEKCVRKDEMKKIEMYMEMMNPITSKFVTRDEVEKLLKEREKITV